MQLFVWKCVHVCALVEFLKINMRKKISLLLKIAEWFFFHLSLPYYSNFKIKIKGINLETEILECEVKWVLESITMNKDSGGDRIPAEWFQIL